MKKVLLIVAYQDFQPLEYGETKRVLEAAGIQAITGSDGAGWAAAAGTGEKARVETVLDKVRVEDYDGVFFIGGLGALEHLDNEESYRIAREIALTDKFFGAICIAPRILAKAGVLAGKKVTGWDGDGQLGDILKEAGAIYQPQKVVADGNLITGSGPAAAKEFGRKIAEVLNQQGQFG
ncbi:MAG: DJ-1/PfpI family protein [Candidatus Magasanikbacteria bacterium]|nr:DJ-1/PfpI family protein [Candidatus Magasanikbacteria bacterium]